MYWLMDDLQQTKPERRRQKILQKRRQTVNDGACQPAEYRPGRGFEIISIMSEGYSITAAAGKMGLHRDKIDEWAKQHPEFADAITRAKGARIFFLETKLLLASNAPSVKAAIFALKMACPQEWDGEQRVDLGSESPIEIFRKQLIEIHQRRGKDLSART
jgi:hypothetical protein